MPTYDYRCKECGHQFEIHQSFADDALTTCPECQGALKKIFSAVGISFKGSGFYKTDSRSGSGTSSSSDKGSSDKSASSEKSTSSSEKASSSSDKGSSSGSAPEKASSSSSTAPATAAS